MAVYVDSLMVWGWRYGKSCHLIGDSIDELKTFAVNRLGMKEQWFQDKASFPHFDLTEKKRQLAVKNGAIELNRTEFVQKMKELKVKYECQ